MDWNLGELVQMIRESNSGNFPPELRWRLQSTNKSFVPSPLMLIRATKFWLSNPIPTPQIFSCT